MNRIRVVGVAVLLALGFGDCLAQSPDSREQLRFVVVVTRHGVRSPTGKVDSLNQYSAEPWPKWSVPPGNLTAHGAKLMTLMGSFDRELFVQQGLLAGAGCGDAGRVAIVADSDQRTRETGKALADGLMPGCAPEVHALAEGTPDALFHPLEAGVGADKAVAAAAVSGRIGGNPEGLKDAYRTQLEALEAVLLGPAGTAKASLLDVPASVGPGKGDHLADLRSPLGTAATMSENLLLEYTEGMPMEQVGWGRVNLPKLRELLELHTASADLERRTAYLAVAGASNLLEHVVDSMQQAVEGKAVAGALGKPQDRVLFLVGHDTNLTNIAGTLNLSWLIDGRRDDTPPGGALVFELWQRGAEFQVRTYFVAATLDQMRNAVPLSLATPPERVPVFVPGCGEADGACRWGGFRKAVETQIQPRTGK